MASNAKVTINQNALKQIADQAAASVAAAYQPVLDSLLDRFAGQPVEEIKPVLAREWAAVNDGSLGEPELTQWATLLSEGTRIVMQPEAP